MRTKEVKNLRMNLGKFLHSYYVKFGEERYEKFLEKIGPIMEAEYGEPFSSDNMRIMEAEFVMFSTKLKDRSKSEDQTQTDIKQ